MQPVEIWHFSPLVTEGLVGKIRPLWFACFPSCHMVICSLIQLTKKCRVIGTGKEVREMEDLVSVLRELMVWRE